MAATTVESTIGTKKIFPVVTIVPANSGADYDLRNEETAPDITNLISTVEGVSGALILGVKTKYKMQSDGFEITAIKEGLDNRLNPRLRYQMTAIVPAPDASGTTITAKRDALTAVNEGTLYDVYGYDPETQLDAWCCVMTNCKVKALPKTTPEGEMFEVTITTSNHGDYDPVWLPVTAPV